MRSHLTPILPPARRVCARGWLARQRCWKAWVGLVLCLAVDSGVAAQGLFYGRNTSATMILNADGSPLKRDFGRVEILVGGEVLSGSKNTLVADGLFDFGVLTVPGAGPGKTVTATIRAWDTTYGATFAAALGVSRLGHGSWTYDLYLGGGDLPPTEMIFFKDLWLQGCIGREIPPPGHVEAQERQPFYYAWPWDGNPGIISDIQLPTVAINQRPVFPVPGYPKGLALGSLAYVSNRLAYIPLPRTYGTDAVYYQVLRTGCSGIGGGNGVVFFEIQPSPARFKPTLFIASGKPGLLALDGHRYRIEKSADLSAWMSAGEVTGNFSEVDLSPFLAPGDRAQFVRAQFVRAQFVRATEIPKP
jgi:hypothetical protein